MKAGFGLVNKKKINKTKTNLPNPAWKTPAYIILYNTHLVWKHVQNNGTKNHLS